MELRFLYEVNVTSAPSVNPSENSGAAHYKRRVRICIRGKRNPEPPAHM